ncbi:acyl-[acyl-carrier-protein] thioesterase [Lewinella sp. 4G2]|uniref:acyl-[acyl-carrier-protein] thioesterase n=1 Tax=Lewinella sp. 4G2 TaxID=1803372 RepID=UPI0007B46788|nr:acyl-ACP thioesterase domain-containing protein [Lewinella sp. 4G2]
MRQSPLHELFSTQVPAYAAGPDGLLTVPYLVRLLQEAAMRNTVRLKISSPELMEAEGLSWILRQQRITIQRWPRMNEAIDILTAPTGFARGLLTYRDFHVLDANDQPIISTVSEWLLMDVGSRKLRPIPDRILALQSDLAPAAAHLERPKIKLHNPTVVDNSTTTKVSYGMLDFNGHLTNPVFPELMLEPLGDTFLSNRKATEITIFFQAEARYGDELTAEIGAGRDGGTAHCLKRGEETLARMLTKWDA